MLLRLCIHHVILLRCADAIIWKYLLHILLFLGWFLFCSWWSTLLAKVLWLLRILLSTDGWFKIRALRTIISFVLDTTLSFWIRVVWVRLTHFQLLWRAVLSISIFIIWFDFVWRPWRCGTLASLKIWIGLIIPLIPIH